MYSFLSLTLLLQYVQFCTHSFTYLTNMYVFLSNVVGTRTTSSCRMSNSSTKGVVDPSGETFEVKNLFVADGSILPTSLGINPMITIEAMAIMISKNVVRRLKLLRPNAE